MNGRSTSGTTGDPCYMPLTRADLDGWIEISSRAYFAAGIRPGMRVIGTYNAGPFVAGLFGAADPRNPVGLGGGAETITEMEKA